MQTTPIIPLQDGEVIFWQGKAQYPRPGIAEYIPALIVAFLLSNACCVLHEAEPFILLNQFCSQPFVGGILVLFLVAFTVFPTVKRKIVAKQTYIFTNKRAVILNDSSGCILRTVPILKLSDCVIKPHRGNLISIIEHDSTGTESTVTLLFAYIPADVLGHYK